MVKFIVSSAALTLSIAAPVAASTAPGPTFPDDPDDLWRQHPHHEVVALTVQPERRPAPARLTLNAGAAAATATAGPTGH